MFRHSQTIQISSQTHLFVKTNQEKKRVSLVQPNQMNQECLTRDKSQLRLHTPNVQPTQKPDRQRTDNFRFSAEKIIKLL
jgi:hypothetical protein